MSSTRGCFGRSFVVGIWLVAVVIVLGLCMLAFLYWRQQQEIAAQFEQPTVLITEPTADASAIAGSYLAVSATAFGRNPITRAELWVDGELKESENSSQPTGDSTLYAHFDLLMSEGPHLIFVRAVNNIGMVGQSMPVSIVGEPKPAQAVRVVRVNPGETLSDQSYLNYYLSIFPNSCADVPPSAP